MASASRMVDVFVAGGGPAGLAVAIAARRKGFRVVVADCRQPPIDKACGEGLMPEGVEALRQLGVHIPSSVSHTFRGIRFIDGEHHADARFPASPGVALRRTILHSLLLDRATELGTEFRWRTRVTALSVGGVIAGGEFIPAKWIVGADGSSSMIRRLAGLGRGIMTCRRFGFRRHFRIVPWSDYTEVYWGNDCQAYVTPINPRGISVAVLSRDPRLRVNQIFEQFPQLASQLRSAEAVGAERGAVSETRALWKVFRGRVLLTGDASGTVDAITGDGLSASFRQALGLSSALESGNFSSYSAAHRRMAIRPFLMSSLLLSLGKHAWLRKRALRALAADPGIFEWLLAFHARSRGVPALPIGKSCRFFCNCLRAEVNEKHPGMAASDLRGAGT